MPVMRARFMVRLLGSGVRGCVHSIAGKPSADGSFGRTMSSLSPVPAALLTFLGSARLASVLSTAAIGVGVFAWTITKLIGWGGLLGMLVALVALCAGSL